MHCDSVLRVLPASERRTGAGCLPAREALWRMRA